MTKSSYKLVRPTVILSRILTRAYDRGALGSRGTSLIRLLVFLLRSLRFTATLEDESEHYTKMANIWGDLTVTIVEGMDLQVSSQSLDCSPVCDYFGREGKTAALWDGLPCP